MQGDERLHFGGIVGGPGDDADAEGVEGLDVDFGVGDEERGVDRREDGELRVVGERVSFGGGHQAGEGIGHGGLLGSKRLEHEAERKGG